MATKQPPKNPRLPFGRTWTEFFPGKPHFTEQRVPDLSGKICIITGATSGIGLQATRILYSKNATIYLLARSEPKARDTIDQITSQHPTSKGSLHFIPLELSELSTIKPCVETFLAREKALHVLINNAGVNKLSDIQGTARTKQGHEIHLGTNIFGPQLLTKLLTPVLIKTAGETKEKGAVRVVWVSSLGTLLTGEPGKGISTDYLGYFPALEPLQRYSKSKAGAWLQGVEYARLYKDKGILSVVCDPGNIQSDLLREGRGFFCWFVQFLCYPPLYGAYTEVYGAVSEDLGIEDGGKWVAPWGRILPIRADLEAATKSEAEGGNGHATQFWEWCDGQIKDFA